MEFQNFDQRVADGLVKGGIPVAITDWLGITFTEAGPGTLVGEMDVREELLTMFGNLHGGVISVLVDHVLGSVMYPVMPRGSWAATTEFKVNLLAPVKGGRLRAEATIISMTKRTGVVRIDVSNDGRPVAAAQGTCLIQPPKPKAE
jgi:1,4-dihydroxy-2-naphthoyl-CoA hydrolase